MSARRTFTGHDGALHQVAQMIGDVLQPYNARTRSMLGEVYPNRGVALKAYLDGGVRRPGGATMSRGRPSG